VSRRSRAGWTAFALAAALLVVPPALAHPDVMLHDGPLRLAPGEVVVRPMALHFHRLVARWAVHGPATEGLWLLVVPAETVGASASAPEDAWFAAPLFGDGRLSQLIDCCMDVSYRHLLLVLRNDGDVTVALDLRAWAMHDEFAVVSARAEQGAVEVPLALFALLGFASLAAAARDRRRLDGAVVPRGWALTASAGLFAAALATAAALGFAGAVRYGGGPVDGMIAVLADVPLPGGPFGSRAALLLGVLLLAWLAAIGAWVLAVGQGAHRRSRWALPLGTVLAFVSLAGGIAMSWTYGGSVVPAALGLVLATPVAVSAWRLRAAATATTAAAA